MDTATAATLADLRQQLEAARKDNAACLKELDAARKDNDFLRGFINNPDVEALRQQLAAARQALNDTDMELARSMRMAEVLATEVRAWRNHDDVHECEPESEWLMRRSINAHDEACRAAQETDRRNALDAAKFEVKP